MPRPADPGASLRCDVAVVGGGPAGLAAAAQLGRAGADVILLDEAPSLGGQYFKRRQGAVLAAYGDYRPAGSALIEAVRRAGVRCLAGRLVWGVDDDGTTLLTADTVSGAGLAIAPRACLVATGAYERAVPFPGWQLPGVVTPGYALHLATCDRIPLGQRVVVAGTGPFLLAAACAVLQAGGGVAAVVELNHPYRPGTASLTAVRFPARLRELAGYAATLARHRVPVLQGRRILAAEGDQHVREVLIGPRALALLGSDRVGSDRVGSDRVGSDRVGSDRVGSAAMSPAAAARTRRVAVDGLAVGFGFRPATELLRLLGAGGLQDELGDVYPRLDDLGRTTVPGVYAAGEVAQIAGVRAAMAGGQLAAAAAAADLGLPPPPPKALRAAGARLAAQRRFAALTARLYPVTAADCAAIPDETMVCRCEGVSAGQLRQVGALGRPDVSSAKAATRAGMGPCQGRQCGAAAIALVSAAAGAPVPAFTARMPVKPIPMSAVLSGPAGSSGSEPAER
jgi:NADPH-dependent 2,4-dienoyl-CoA reductase/sulfur reductase-like enzyme